MSQPSTTTEQRAALSAGTSADAIYAMVARLLASRWTDRGTLLDVGCGRGDLWPFVKPQFDRYIGVDVLRYEGFPADGQFEKLDLDTGRVPFPDASADVVCGVETIEHLENPRAFARELTRLCRPGGWIVITTPNQLSWLSKFTLLVKNQFNAFGPANYPAHITALLQIDLQRIARECGWEQIGFGYSLSGRIVFTSRCLPGWVSRMAPRAFSDNIAVIGRRAPADAAASGPAPTATLPAAPADSAPSHA